ncbi:MAG TPA: molybdenum cofactor biosynthesis protein MoaE [Acidimicrobiia bacterium]|nr:molybdenum cofactor biosynthesis protein MoaE [Acidimicrobiia bacterium]
MEFTQQSVRVAVLDRPLDPAATLEEVGRTNAGALAVFVGTVRDHSADRSNVTHLEYEAFEGRVGDVIGSIVEEAYRRWPILAGVVEHRVGRVGLGEPAVVVAVSTAHRADAFEAARYLIDEVKKRAPLWKKEHWPGGAEWVEGA